MKQNRIKTRNGLGSGSTALSLLMTLLMFNVARSQNADQSRLSEMVLLPKGHFQMGYTEAYPDEMPVHRVAVNSFYLDRHEVTNRQFLAFVTETGHVTKAEETGQCWAYVVGETEWSEIQGADWRHPQGPGSDYIEVLDHPVVCVSWEDAAAFAKWAGKRLPTEAEWEYAARAGTANQYVANTSHTKSNATPVNHAKHFGHDLHVTQAVSRDKDVGNSSKKEIVIEANVWQGHWPEKNYLTDDHYYTSAAGTYEANGFGITDMIGNVWEWTADWYDSTYYSYSPIDNPSGPSSGQLRVARGGSWFCSPNYCGAYSSHYRGSSPFDRAFNNVGFRCARDVTN